MEILSRKKSPRKAAVLHVCTCEVYTCLLRFIRLFFKTLNSNCQGKKTICSFAIWSFICPVSDSFGMFNSLGRWRLRRLGDRWIYSVRLIVYRTFKRHVSFNLSHKHPYILYCFTFFTSHNVKYSIRVRSPGFLTFCWWSTIMANFFAMMVVYPVTCRCDYLHTDRWSIILTCCSGHFFFLLTIGGVTSFFLHPELDDLTFLPLISPSHWIRWGYSCPYVAKHHHLNNRSM